MENALIVLSVQLSLRVGDRGGRTQSQGSDSFRNDATGNLQLFIQILLSKFCCPITSLLVSFPDPPPKRKGESGNETRSEVRGHRQQMFPLAVLKGGLGTRLSSLLARCTAVVHYQVIYS